jgi:hypothetical protein
MTATNVENPREIRVVAGRRTALPALAHRLRQGCRMKRPSRSTSRLPWLFLGLLAACDSGLRLGPDGGDGGLGPTGGSPASPTTPAGGGAGGGGTDGAGGVPSGVVADSGTGGSAGAPDTGGANGNVRVCPSFPTGSLCYTCDPLPAGRTDGCPPATTFCSDYVDPNSDVRYPDGCNVKYPQYNVPYHPNELQSAYCHGSVWVCLR